MALISQKIQAFIAIAEQGSVHGAARQLRLTQTAVTRRLAVLEDEMVATLFIRSRRGMSLTEAGHSLLSYARQVTDLEGEVLAKINGHDEVTLTHVRVYGSSSILRSRIIPAVSNALRDFPQVTYSFLLSDNESGVDALKSGDVDFAILEQGDVVDEFSSKRLRPERYLIVGPPQWKKRKIADVVKTERIIDFKPSDLMTFNILTALGLRHLARTDRIYVNNTDALSGLVAAGHGYSVLTEEFAEEALRSKRLTTIGSRHHLDFPVALAWYPRRYLPKHFKAVINAIS